jgi:hypothetical protein
MKIIGIGATNKNLLKKGILFLLFFMSYLSHGQFYHGIELGINMTNADFIVNESAEPSSAIGFHLGYLAERDITDNLYLRLGFNFNRREFNAISRRGINTTNEKWGIDAIEIPVNLGYYLNWNNRNFQFFVDAGINLGYNSRVTTKNDRETIRLDIGSDADINRISIGANASVGLLIKKRMKVRLNYYNGLSNIVNTEENIWKNKTFGVSLSYFLREKQVY